MGRIWAGLLVVCWWAQPAKSGVYRESGEGRGTSLGRAILILVISCLIDTFKSELPLRAGHCQGGHAPLVPLVQSVAQNLQYSTVQCSTVQYSTVYLRTSPFLLTGCFHDSNIVSWLTDVALMSSGSEGTGDTINIVDIEIL